MPADETLEKLREPDLLANKGLQSLDTIPAKNKPELEGAKPPPQGNLPVTVVDHRP